MFVRFDESSLTGSSIKWRNMLAMIVPCFNEAERFDSQYWVEMLTIPDTQWIFVNDGSTDDTRHCLRDIKSRTGAEVVDLQTNLGKANAIRAALLRFADESHFPLVTSLGFMDADGAFDRKDVQRLSQLHETLVRDGSADATWSARVDLSGRSIERSPSRHYVGRIVSTVLSVGVADLPYDTQSGLKLFARGPTLFATIQEPFETRWLFEVEMLSRWRTETGQDMKVWEEPLDRWKEISGSKITPREYLRIASEIIRVKRLQRALDPWQSGTTSVGGSSL